MPHTSFTEYGHFIHQEMLVHPALFTHPKATKIAIIGNQENTGVLEEALKHATVQEIWHITPEKAPTPLKDTRIHAYVGKSTDWLVKVKPESLDVIIVPEKATDFFPNNYQQFLNALLPDGILIQQCDSLFDLTQLKSVFNALKTAGFNDIQVVHFPQPSFPSGWRATVMAHKNGAFKRIREKDIFNKPFNTHYYNFDTHKAALVLPEFMREELNP